MWTESLEICSDFGKPSSNASKQRCQASLILFGFCIEVLANCIKAKDGHIRGVIGVDDCRFVDGIRVSIELYADDLNLLSLSHRRLQCLLHVLSKVSVHFGNAGLS